jgi:hypothetical protein
MGQRGHMNREALQHISVPFILTPQPQGHKRWPPVWCAGGEALLGGRRRQGWWSSYPLCLTEAAAGRPLSPRISSLM